MRRRNLVLVTIDAWRADYVDSYAGVPLTPSLAARSARTVRFDGLYANGPWTTPALVSLFTGESPARHGVAFAWSGPRPGGPAVAALLRDAGWAVPNLCYLNRVENYGHLGYEAAESPAPPAGPDDALLLSALRAHRGAREPFFLWFHYKHVHLPYWPAVEHRRALGVDDEALPARLRDSVCSRFVVPRHEHTLDPVADREPVRRLYAAGVRQMDVWLDRVLGELERPDGGPGGSLAERTTLVVTADHGEELLEHGFVGHASTAHHASLHDELLRVPLLVLDARVAAPRRLATRLQGLDLFPTLLSLAGLEPPPCTGVDLSAPVLDASAAPPADAGGRDFYFHSARMGYLTPPTHGAHVVEAVSDGRTKLVRERFDHERVQLYDLASDPEELGPLTDGEALRAGVAWLDAVRERERRGPGRDGG